MLSLSVFSASLSFSFLLSWLFLPQSLGCSALRPCPSVLWVLGLVLAESRQRTDGGWSGAQDSS